MKLPSEEFDLNLDTAPGRRPGGAWRLWTASAGLSAGLGGVLVWSLQPPEPAPALPTAAVQRAVEEPPAERSEPLEAGPRAAPPTIETRAWAPVRRVTALEQLTLGVLRPGVSRPEPLRLGEALGGAVAVVNVWASYCAPCLRELPEIQAMARAEGWGRAVRLVPVMAEPLRPDDPRQAEILATLRGEPAAPRLLVDPEGALATTLREAALVRADGLPITLVFACGALAWARVGAVAPDVLSAAVAAGRRTAAACRAEEAVPAPAGPACGDGLCDAAESCTTCGADCSCKDGTVCVAGHCVRPAEELKP